MMENLFANMPKLRHTLPMAALAAALSLHAAAAPLVFHVARNGSDKWSGRFAAPNAPRTDGPFATVERARDAVRDLKLQNGHELTQSVEIYLHGGTYTLDRPLHFAPEDSGTAECPVLYAAYGSEKPLLSGGRAISGWKQATVDGKRLWTVEIPDVREGRWYFRELWMNGQRRTRARSPNTGFFRISAVPDLDIKQPYQNGQQRFQYAPGEIAQWKNPEDVNVVIMSFWISQRRGIASLDEAQHMVNLNSRSAMRLTDGFGMAPKLARYYVENAFELLDSPGEWYLNRKTGVLYYMPLPGERMEKAEAVAPVLDQLLAVEGEVKEDRRVEYLTFRGLTFAYAEWWLPADGMVNRYWGQAAASVPGAIKLNGARHCSFEQCTLAHVSSYGIHFSRGCDHDRVVHSDLFDLGTGGVTIGEPDRIGNLPPGMKSPFPDDPKEETHDIEISDNEIHEGSRVIHHGHGVWVGQSYNNLISHNHIYDFYQIGISVGWTWGYGKSLAHNNVVEYNHIHQIGQKWSSDLAGIYTLGGQPGTVLRYNLIHDVECADYVGRGIYLDEGSQDMVVENNVIYRTTTGGFGLNYGRRNTIRNNIFALGELSQIEPVGGMNKPAALEGSDYVLERNLFYWKAGENFLRGQRPKQNDRLNIHGNLYWQEGGGAQAPGFDPSPLVADPLFVDPAKADFRLKPGSPAAKIGFQPIDLSEVGPRGGAGPRPAQRQ